MDEIDIIDKRINNLNKRIDNLDAVVSRYMRIKRNKVIKQFIRSPQNISLFITKLLHE